MGRDLGWSPEPSTGSTADVTGERSEHLLYIGQSTTSPNADFSTPDRFPQIIKLASELEFNLGSEPIISCVATGNPLPASDGVELRKADGTMLKVPHTPHVHPMSSPRHHPWALALHPCCRLPQNQRSPHWPVLPQAVMDGSSVPTAGQSHHRAGADHLRVPGEAPDEGRRGALGVQSLYHRGPGQPESQGQHPR